MIAVPHCLTSASGLHLLPDLVKIRGCRRGFWLLVTFMHRLLFMQLSNDCLVLCSVNALTGKSQRAALVFVGEEGANAALQVTCSSCSCCIAIAYKS